MTYDELEKEVEKARQTRIECEPVMCWHVRIRRGAEIQDFYYTDDDGKPGFEITEIPSHCTVCGL